MSLEIRRFAIAIFYILFCTLLVDVAWSMDTVDFTAKKFLPKKKSRNLRTRFEKQKDDLIVRSIEKEFNYGDRLFAQAQIKVQGINDKLELGKSRKMSLERFLSRPHKIAPIVKIIEHELVRSLSQQELGLIKAIPKRKLSLPAAIRALWLSNIITNEKAQLIILKHSPIKSTELIRLMENGVVHTSKGFLVHLRTGSDYGDILKLFETMSNVYKKIKRNSFNPDQLFDDPLDRVLLEAFGNDQDFADKIIHDSHLINAMREHFLFINSLSVPIRYRLGGTMSSNGSLGSLAEVNTTNSWNLFIRPLTLSAVFIGNHYFKDINASLSNALFVNTRNITYAGSLNFEDKSGEWWVNYSEGYLGAGIDFTANLDQATAWTNSCNPTFINVGGNIGGWSNNLSAGLNLSTMLANGVGLGASVQIDIGRDHTVAWLGTEELDAKSPKIRGQHKLEITDSKSFSVTGSILASGNMAAIPVTGAFNIGATRTRNRVYRTHTSLLQAQRMLTEADVAGLLYLFGKSINETKIPSFEDPDALLEGDELVETKIGTLSGSFIIGVEIAHAQAAVAAQVGGSVAITAEFELGLKRLPNNKFEVSIEPKRVFEMGLHGRMLAIITMGRARIIEVARKQIFAFDFNELDARQAYFSMITDGHLPTNEDIDHYTLSRGPEYLLTKFRSQNIDLAKRGIARTYLEKVNIVTDQIRVGLDVPLISALADIHNKIDEKKHSVERHPIRFEGKYREFIHSHSESVATNGLISVTRSTYGEAKNTGQGFSGKYSEEVFITHRRIYTVDDAPTAIAVNRWQFDSLLAHAQLKDTIITGDQENKMAAMIDQRFSAFIGQFKVKNSKALRIVDIEREFTKKDLIELSVGLAQDHIPRASIASGISQERLARLLKSLKGEHPDYQAMLIKDFIEESGGLAGFAAMHQLLGAKPEEIFIRTESGYSDTVLDVKKFITQYTNPDPTPEGSSIMLLAIDDYKNKKAVKRFFNIRQALLDDLDNQLRLLRDDRYYLDEESPLMKIYDKDKIKELHEMGVRQDKTPLKTALVSARKTLLEITNLDNQHYSQEDRELIYRLAKKKRLSFIEAIEVLLFKYENRPIDTHMDKRYLRKRLGRIWKAIAAIDDEITAIDNDGVMQEMDPEYLATMRTELVDLRARLAHATAIDHLTSEDLARVKNRLRSKESFPLRLFNRHRRTDYLIDGALATVYRDGIPTHEINISNFPLPKAMKEEKSDSLQTQRDFSLEN